MVPARPGNRVRASLSRIKVRQTHPDTDNCHRVLDRAIHSLDCLTEMQATDRLNMLMSTTDLAGYSCSQQLSLG